MNAKLRAADEPRVLLLPATRRDGEAIASFLERHQISFRVCHSTMETAQAIGDDVGALVLTDHVTAERGSHLIALALSRQPAWSDLPVLCLSKVGTESRELSEFVESMTNVTLLDRPASTRSLLSAIQAALRSRNKQYQMRDQLLALQSAESALRESDRVKDEFLAMLAHELRNPLAPVRTAIDLLPRLISSDDGRFEATLGVVDRQVSQLTRLVDDLLDVSRITQGRIEIRRAIVDLSSILSQALESVQPQINDKQHTVSCSLPVSVYVAGDRARLVQCVSNILANAVKYTDAGGLISVKLAGDEHRAVLSVSDTGIGISKELLPNVFDLFVQDARSLDRAQGGLGIGLSVARKLVEMHGGQVTAASAGVGQGSTFEIVLPRAAEPGTARLDAQERETTDTAALRVLVVDDNKDAADSLAMLLSIEGHTAKAVYGSREAIKLTHSFKPQLILLDIGLPDMDGYEVARELRAAGVTAWLVALTGYGQQKDIDRSMAAGFDAHVVKPIEAAKLASVLQGLQRPVTGIEPRGDATT